MPDATYDAIILAAGEGSRLAPNSVPRFFKPILEVDGKMLIEHSVEFAKDFKVENIHIVTNPRLEPVLKGIFPPMHDNIRYETQDQPRGVLDAIDQAMYMVQTDYVIVLCADNTYGAFNGHRARLTFETFIKDERGRSAVTTNWFNDDATNKRLTGFKDGILYPRGTCDDCPNWMGPLILDTLSVVDLLKKISERDLYDTQLLEQHLNEIAHGRFVEMAGDCADWGIVSKGNVLA